MSGLESWPTYFIRELGCSLSNDTGLLLLCEVAAKPFYEQNNANYNADADCKANVKRHVLFDTYVIIIYDRSLGARKDLGEYSQSNGKMRVSLSIILPLMAVICLMDQGSPLPIQIYICSITRFVPSYKNLVLIHTLWQYIVYNPSQIRLRYLLMVDMN